MRTLPLCLLLLLIHLPGFSTPISLALKNAPTAEVIAYLAEESGQNVVISENLKETKALRLENRDFDAILHSLSHIHQLHLTREKGVYYLSSQPVKANHTPALSTTPLPPKLLTKTIPLHYTKAADLVASLTQGSGSVLSENGYLHFDQRANSLIIKDTAAAIQTFTELVKQLDQPITQIAIEARIVTISSENLKELGVRWGMLSSPQQSDNGALRHPAALNVNFPVNNAPSMLLQVASINSRVLDLELTALERENSVEIIASPRLLTTNKQRATIKQGTEIPYVIYNNKGESRNIEFREAVLGLEVTPHLAKHNQILLDLVVSQNAPNSQSIGNELITIDKQEINTQVIATHGETIVLGGIFQHLIAKGEDRVPLLGSLPVVKRLFSQARDKIAKRELVIFVTPYILPHGTISPSVSPSSTQKPQKSQQK